MPTLSSLPNECLLFIIEYIGVEQPRDICALSQANRRLAALTADVRLYCLALASQSNHWTGPQGSWGRKPAILAQAALDNDMPLVRRLLSRGSLNVAAYRSRSTYYTDSALGAAIRGGHLDMFDYLAEQQPNALKRFLKGDLRRRTGLCHAVRCQQLEMVNRLLDLGAGVNISDYSGDISPLAVAVETGNVAIIRALLDRGALVEPDSCGLTPLHSLGPDNVEEVLRLLLAAGADINAQSNTGATPLHTACAGGHDKKLVVEALISAGAELELRDEAGFTPFVVALEKGGFGIVRLLVAKGAVMAHPKWRSLLSFAAQRSSVKLLQYFLDQGLKLPQDNDPLRFSTYLEYDYLGPAKSPLSYAAEENCANVVKLLLEQGHPVNHTDQRARQPLHFAKGECVGILLENGAVVNACDLDGLSPFHYAVRDTDLDKAKVLFESEPDYVRQHLSDSMFCLRSSYPQPNPKDAINTLQFLLDSGADIGALSATPTKQTILHVMADLARCEETEFLIDKGANLEAKDSLSRTPLMIACLSTVSEALDIVTLFIRRGSNLRTRDNQGKTALHLSAMLGQLGFCKVLAEAGGPDYLNLKDDHACTPEQLYMRHSTGNRRIDAFRASVQQVLVQRKTPGPKPRQEELVDSGHYEGTTKSAVVAVGERAPAGCCKGSGTEAEE